MDSSPSGFSVCGILLARILEWVALPFSRDISHPGIELESLMSPALAGRFFTTSTTWEPPKSSPKPVTKNRGWGMFLHSLSFRALVLNCFSWFSPHKALFFFSTSSSNHYCSPNVHTWLLLSLFSGLCLSTAFSMKPFLTTLSKITLAFIHSLTCSSSLLYLSL